MNKPTFAVLTTTGAGSAVVDVAAGQVAIESTHHTHVVVDPAEHGTVIDSKTADAVVQWIE